MNDYHLTVRIKNGRIKKELEKCGIKSVAELSRKCGVKASTICGLINFKISPRIGYNWKSDVLKMCAFLGISTDELFPEHMMHVISTNKIEKYVEENQLTGTTEQKQITPYSSVLENDMTEIINEVMKSGLDDREIKILKEKFWDGKTHKEISEKYNLSYQHIQIIEQKALRKLRSPRRIRILEPLLEQVTEAVRA